MFGKKNAGRNSKSSTKKSSRTSVEAAKETNAYGTRNCSGRSSSNSSKK